MVNIRERGMANCTGRFTFFAATAASHECGQGKSLQPNPDPMKREMTSMFSSGNPRTCEATL